MASIPIMCLICNASIKDSQFPIHMQSVHGGLSQSEAIVAEKNIPTQQSPIILDKDAPPSDDFMEVAQMLDKPKEAPPVPKPVETTPARNVSLVQEEPKPIKLEYRYSGQCKDCRIGVETLVVKVKGQTVAVAFCTRHGQLAEREVADLKEIVLPKQSKEEIEIIKTFNEKYDKNQRKEVKHDKRSKPVVQPEATL